VRLRRAAIVAVIRVLTEDHDLHVVGARQPQCAEHVGRVDRLAGRAFVVDEAAQRRVCVAVDERLQHVAPYGGQCIELRGEVRNVVRGVRGGRGAGSDLAGRPALGCGSGRRSGPEVGLGRFRHGIVEQRRLQRRAGGLAGCHA